jgi:ABC-type sugar transport system substrate-binding protein
MTRHHRISAVAAGLTTMAVLAVIGCSSASGSPADGASPAVSSSGSRASVSAAVSAAEALVRQYTAMQPAISVAPLKYKPPAGKTVAIITCAFPSCMVFANAGASAASKLGWTTKIYNEGSTVETYVSVWNQVLQTPPSLIFYVAAAPNSLLSAPLARVHQLGIPTVALSTSESPNDVVRATIGGSTSTALSGKLMGAAVVADAKGPADTVWAWDPTTAIAFSPIKDGFTQEVTAAGGTVNVLTVSGDDVGRALPGQLVSYLQAHPNVKYLATPAAAFLPGVPEALQSAGLTDVKIVAIGPASSDLAALKVGTEWCMVANENAILGYRAIDTLARILEGMPFNPNPAGSQQLLFKDNVTSSVEPATLGNPEAAFLTAWHVS